MIKIDKEAVEVCGTKEDLLFELSFICMSLLAKTFATADDIRFATNFAIDIVKEGVDEN